MDNVNLQSSEMEINSMKISVQERLKTKKTVVHIHTLWLMLKFLLSNYLTRWQTSGAYKIVILPEKLQKSRWCDIY